MSTSTPNFNLTKPAGSENVDIATINSNMDKIDAGVEPIHATRTVTGSSGSITISDALDAPLQEFTAVGMGSPAVFYIEGEIGSQMGSQSWGAPMILDVPLAIADGELTPVLICYGEGVGANSYCPTAGEETGTAVYLNAKELAALFDDAKDEKATVTSEVDYYVYECPLPFSVATNSAVYCSHLVNRNAEGSEGIWADGDTLYLRISKDHSGGDSFEDLAHVMRGIAAKVNWYDLENLKGFEDKNLYDFFVCLTASASTIKPETAKAVKLENGALSLSYFKISDFIALASEDEPSPTPISSMSATYYLDSTVNRTLRDTVSAALEARFSQAALGIGAEATKVGGAVGAGASATHGAAVGGGAVETRGGAAVGYQASATGGGAAGAYAEETGGGAAVGYQARTSYGAAIGNRAQCLDDHDEPLDAVQLGTGTNRDYHSMKVYNTELLTSSGYIPLSLINSSYQNGTELDKANFLAIGDSRFANKANNNGGGELGTNASATTGGAIGNGATATTGFAGGNGATATDGGVAIGDGASATATKGVAIGTGAVSSKGVAIGNGAYNRNSGTAVGTGANSTDGGACGPSTKTFQGGAIGNAAESNYGGACGRLTKAGDGAAVGMNAQCNGGVALGNFAQCKSGNTLIDAIQLGTGTNATAYSMQVYTTPLLTPVTAGTANDGLVIPLSLITASYNAATASEKNDFDLALGNIVRYSITNDLIGAGIGTFVKLTSNGTVSEAWEDGDVFIGQLAEVPSSGANTALVRIKGVMETEAMLGLGLQRVAFSDGTLDISANGREIFVTSCINGRVTFIV